MHRYDKGTYQGRVAKWGISAPTSEDGKYYFLYVEFQVTDRVSGGDAEALPEEDRHIRSARLYFSPNTRKMVAKAVRALVGFDLSPSEYRRLDPKADDAIDLGGVTLRAYVKHETGNNDRVYEKWTIKSPEYVEAAPAALDTFFNNYAAEAAAQENAQEQEEELPF
jgi:hypothetical protein